MTGDMRVPSMSDNRDLACYFITKHAWKGKYKRLFSVGSHGITTYNPETLRVTNQWPYSEICCLVPDEKGKDSREARFVIGLRKAGKKREDMRFSSEHTPDLLTEALRFHPLFGMSHAELKRFNASKYRWSEKRIPVVLQVNLASLDQIDTATQKIITSYDYKDIELLIPISDFPGALAVAHGGFARLHLFILNEREALMRAIADAAANNVGISLRQSRDPVSFQYYLDHRMGKYSDDEHLTSHAEFQVQKHVVSRHGESPVRRLLCLTETCMVERDPDTYLLITAKPLCDVFALIRYSDEPQKLVVEYVRGTLRTYYSTDRDALIASILDGVRASGNRDVCVKMRPTERGFRFGPFTVPVTEEVESQHMKFLQQLPLGMSFAEAVIRFNANISYSGLLHAVTQEGLFSENKEKLIKGSLQALITREGDQSEISSADLEAQFHALRRLVASKAGFQAFTTLPGMRETLGKKVVTSLRRNDEGVTHAAIDTINALMQPMHDNGDIRQEQLNKASIMSNKKFLENLLDILTVHVFRGTGALVISGMLDFLTFTICYPYSETSDGGYFDQLLQMVADRGRSLFKLFNHPSLAIVKGAGMVMRALIEEGDAGIGSRMQNLALAEGALPQHLLTSLYCKSSDSRSLTNRQLSRHLVGLWTSDNTTVSNLLKRVFPPGMIQYLDSTDEPPIRSVDHLFVRDNLKMAQEHLDSVQKRNAETLRVIERQLESILTHWRTKIGMEAKQQKDDPTQKPVCLRKRRQKIKSTWNWKMFYYQFHQDHAKPNLIWNNKTRDELREALEKELHEFNREREFTANSVSSSVDSGQSVLTNSQQADKDAASTNGTVGQPSISNLAEQLQNQASLISWNFVEFKIIYPSLQSETRVGDYYLRLLLDEDLKYSTSQISQVSARNSTLSASGAHNDASSVSSADQENEKDNQRNEANAVGGLVKIKHSYEFFNDLFRRFLQYHQPEMKCMCLQAMTIVYGRCYKEVGPVTDTDLLVGMLERTNNRMERDRLLFLIEKLVLDKKNIECLIDANGIRIIVDLLTLAHLHVSRAHTPQQTNVICDNPESEGNMGIKEWYYQIPPKQQQGPFSFKEFKALYKDGTINAKTRVWAQGMEGWKSLEQVPQLKWTFVATGDAVLNESELATLILRILITVCSAYPSQDEFGAVIRPMPRAKKQLTNPANLPHIVQILLTFDPVLVDKVAIVLNMVMEDNPFVARLYLSGVFFFVLMYTGSNLLPIASFLKYTHLKQAFRSEENQSSDIMFRSILGHILPEAMVCFLENHSAEKFAQIFLGEYDTPEAIWNSEMRRFMIERLASHLAEFTPRLPSNTRALYQYLPIPVIVYPQLQNELFCNTYYLRHLCDAQRFPNWPIREPVKLMRDILKAWKDEVEKKPPTMSLADAYRELGLDPDKITPGNEEASIRRAYFKMAQKYHPDKNPEGRDKFEAVNKAYDYLCSRSKLSDGPNPKNIVLILRAQSILFSRCKEALAPHKYAGYPMLIKTIVMETQDDSLFQKETPLLAAACELAYNTVNSSALNAEEMRRENGIQILQEAFSRCVSIISASSTPDDLPVRVCGYVTVFYSVASQFPACRERIQELHQIVKDLLRLLYFKNLPQLACLVARCISSFSVDFWLQTNLFENGALYHLLPFVFNYDFTLDQSGVEKDESSHKQEILNRLAVYSLMACARLAGCPSELSSSNANTDTQTVSPDNPAVRKSLSGMLTPYIARKITEFTGDKDQLKDLLKTLTSNTCSPYLLWDNRNRSELLQYLESQQKKLVKSGECDTDYGANFQYTLYDDEIIVGEVFVRIYNEQKTFPLENPKSFAIDLLLYLNEEGKFLINLANAAQSGPKEKAKLFTPELKKRVSRVEMVLEALSNVLNFNAAVKIQCIGHFKLLFSLLTLVDFPMVQQRALEVIVNVTSNQECLSDIAASDVIVYLMMLFQTLPQCHSLMLDALTRMVVVTNLLKEVVYRGAIIYLLDLICNSTRIEVRVETASLLSKMMLDKLVGKRIRAILLQFLPALFLDAMRDSPDSCLHLYETVHENPELIWNDDAREKLSETVTNMKKTFYEEQLKDPSVKWSVPEDFSVNYAGDHEEELIVGSVYVRLYVANPGWVLRAPEDFLNNLITKWSEHTSSASSQRSGDQMELITTAICFLLQSQAGLVDTMSRKGFVHQIFQTMLQASKSHDDAVLKSGLLIIHQMASSKFCVSSMCSLEAITPIIETMKRRPDQLSAASETLHRMFDYGLDELVAQALKARLIPYLLELLSTGLVMVPDQGPTKAHIVNALKAMQKSLQHGDQVSSLLNNSPIWKEFKDQSHDLFLTNDSNIAGYLTGRTPEVAGYLMSSGGGIPSSSMQPPSAVNSAPPPPPS